MIQIPSDVNATQRRRAQAEHDRRQVRHTPVYQINVPISVKIHTFILLANMWAHLFFFKTCFYIYIFTVKYCLFQQIFTGAATKVSGSASTGTKMSH